MSYPNYYGSTRPPLISITGETSFSLAYGYEAMVPVKIGAGSLQRENYNLEQNEIQQRHELDFIKEK